MLTLFNAGTTYFWILTLLLIAASIGAVYMSRGAVFLLSLLAYVGLVQFMGDTPIIQTVFSHRLWFVIFGTGFLAMSVFWFNTRWYWLTAKHRLRYNIVLDKWLKEHELDVLPIPENHNYEQSLAIRAEWDEWFPLHNNDDYGVIEFRPSFSKHKNEILTWMTAWPLDVPIWFFTEVCHDFWLLLYYRFKDGLQWIMERNWRGTEYHMLTEQEKEEWAKIKKNRKVAVRDPVSSSK